MSSAKIRSVCRHRFLMITGMNCTRSVEISRCYECGTSLVRPLMMTPTEWFPFPQKKLYCLETKASARTTRRSCLSRPS